MKISSPTFFRLQVYFFYDIIQSMKTFEQELKKIKLLINNLINIYFLDLTFENSKFIRSKLALLYLLANNYKITPEIHLIIALGEIIHNASLLHDDVIDDAELRRGKETVAKKFSPQISILAGDYLLLIVIENLMKLNNSKISSIFINCSKKMIEAEFEQYFMRGKIPSEKQYLEICKNKTALLFSAVLQSCSILVGENEVLAKEFGEDFGICFQIKNDLEVNSAEIDLKNEIYTAKKVLGIEKTNSLLDNYKVKMKKALLNIPSNVYKDELESLIELL